MKLTIKNEDSSRTARVRVLDKVSPVEGDLAATEGWKVSDAEGATIPPGESCEMWIHSGRKIEISEVQS